ncbi:ABC transporter substrate-binding protein [Anaeromassilibacillus sp. SJQ-1]|uniref:ABC transporter substrate-binding protein n=1 Tax=Anaeromassilibacillus sp. SJQ-1 TaxID=3375419 RepID=UPI003988B3DD
MKTAIPSPDRRRRSKSSDDGLTWDITLRDDIKWSDGEPVTVDDFIYSWQRAASPETASDYANLFDVIEGGADVYQGNANPSTLGVTKVDDTHMTVKLAAPCPYFDKLLAFPVYYPVRKDVVDGNDGCDPGCFHIHWQWPDDADQLEPQRKHHICKEPVLL